MTAYALIQESISFLGVDPPVVTCAVETPDGQIDVYQYGVDPQIARSGIGVYQIQIPQTVNGTDAAPYIFYWQPGGITQLLPPTGVIIPPPAPPPPPPGPGPVVTPHLTPSAQPGLFMPGLAEPGLPGGVAVAVAAPSPPPTSGALPDTTNNIHLFLPYNNSETPVGGQMTAEVGVVDYVFSATGNGTARLSPLPAPGVNHGYYVPWFQDVPFGTEPTIAASHPDWLLYRSDRTTLAYYNASQPISTRQPMLDFTNPAVQDYILNSYILPALATGGYQSISFDDNPSYNYSQAAGHYDLSNVWVQQYSGASSDSAWTTASLGAMDQIVSRIETAYPNVFVAANQAYDCYYDMSRWSTILGHVDLIFDEGGFTNYGDSYSQSPTGNYVTTMSYANCSTNPWLSKMTALQNMQKNYGMGLALNSEEPYVATANQSTTNSTVRFDVQWTMANYLLIKYNHTFLGDLRNDPGDYGSGPVWQPEYGAQIGSPTDDFYASQNVYMRDFTGGLAVVNPSNTTSYTITLPAGTYKDLYGVAITSYTMTAHSGLVLLHV